MREIFEGDIVRVPRHFENDHDYPECLGVIRFEDAEYAVHKLGGDFICTIFELIHSYHGEVIGNIYDNPEKIDAI